MEKFFLICEYLGITPIEFFDIGTSNPVQLGELISELKGLDTGAVEHILGLVRSLHAKK